MGAWKGGRGVGKYHAVTRSELNNHLYQFCKSPKTKKNFGYKNMRGGNREEERVESKEKVDRKGSER